MPTYLETTYIITITNRREINYRVSESQDSEAAKAANDGLLAGVSASVEMCSLSTKDCHEIGKKPLQRNKMKCVQDAHIYCDLSQEAGQAIPAVVSAVLQGHRTCRCLQHRTYKCLKEIEKETT